jgi:hypothetical protein
MLRIWSQMCEGKVTDVNGFLMFEDKSLKWDDVVSRLFVRQTYLQLFEEIINLSVERILILGSPGVGKSLFVWYLMYAAVNSAQKCGKPVPSIVYQLRDGQHVLFSVSNGIPAMRSTVVGRFPCDMFISNTAAPPDNYPARCRVHVSSEGSIGYKVFEKAIDGSEDTVRNITRFMPPFEENEAVSVGSSRGIPAEAMKTRYMLFGGSFRALMSVGEDSEIGEADEISACVEAAFSSYFEDVALSREQKAVVRGCKSVVVSKIRRFRSLSRSVEATSFFQHWIQHPASPSFGVKVWASDFMKWLAGVICEQRQSGLVSNLVQMLDEVAMFETCSHREIYKNLKAGSQYLLCGLSSSEAFSMGGSDSLLTHRCLIRTPDCLRALPEGSYAKLAIRNFGAVDAVVKLHGVVYFLQMTVGNARPGKENALATLIRILCPNNERRVMVFVLELDNFTGFKVQRNYGNTPQYKCLADNGSAAAVQIQVTSPRKPKGSVAVVKGKGVAFEQEVGNVSNSRSRKRQFDSRDVDNTGEDDVPELDAEQQDREN